jgi:surface protein
MSKITVSGVGALSIGKQTPASTRTEWTRPADWLTVSSVGSSEQKFVGLRAIFPDDENFTAFTVSGAFTVNWGDGTIENFTSGSTAYRTYSYDNVAFDGTLSSRGYKQAIITITPQAGQNLTALNLNIRHNRSGLLAYETGWLDIEVGSPSFAAGRSLIIGQTAETVRMSMLERVRLSNLGNITDASAMFRTCRNLQSVTFPSDTSKLVNINTMFRECLLLRTIPLFNTAAVTNMDSMFRGCRSLQTVPLLNTAAVTNMNAMFFDCGNLLEVPLFVTTNVTNMNTMFSFCRAIRSIPLFDTSKVITMVEMFRGCYSLQSVPLFNTVTVTSMNGMFYDCDSLRSVPLFNTSNVTVMNDMFRSCVSLLTVPLFDTSKVTNMAAMFFSCNSLQSVPLFNTAAVITINAMFYDCLSLESVPLFNTSNATNMAEMFRGCLSLRTVPLLVTSKAANTASMFYLCTALRTIPQFNTSNSTNMGTMFRDCNSLQSIPLLDSSKVTVMDNMFNGCVSLSSVPAMNVSTVSSSVNFGSMFLTCTSLARIQAKDFRFTFSVASNKLSNTALNEIYTNLPTVVGQTITVTGNYGAATSNTTIATNKGWTVTT